MSQESRVMSLETIRQVHSSIIDEASEVMDTDVLRPYGVGLRVGLYNGFEVPEEEYIGGLHIDIDVAVAKDFRNYSAGKQMGKLLAGIYILGLENTDV